MTYPHAESTEPSRTPGRDSEGRMTGKEPPFPWEREATGGSKTRSGAWSAHSTAWSGRVVCALTGPWRYYLYWVESPVHWESTGRGPPNLEVAKQGRMPRSTYRDGGQARDGAQSWQGRRVVIKTTGAAERERRDGGRLPA